MIRAETRPRQMTRKMKLIRRRMLSATANILVFDWLVGWLFVCLCVCRGTL